MLEAEDCGHSKYQHREELPDQNHGKEDLRKLRRRGILSEREDNWLKIVRRELPCPRDSVHYLQALAQIGKQD